MHIWQIDWVLFSDIHMQTFVPPNINLICGLVWIFLCGLLTASDKSQFIWVWLIFFFTFNTAVVIAVWAGQIFKCTKFDYSWQLHSHKLKGLGNPDHIESSPYVQDMLAYELIWETMKMNCWDCYCLNYEVFNMHSLLDRSVHCGYDCFRVDFRSLLQVTYYLSKPW